MKLFFLIMSFTCLYNSNPALSDITEITQAVHDFVKSADDRNLKNMDNILHDDYRAITNQLFGGKEIQCTDKSSYLDLLKNEIIGGDQREIKILSVDLEGQNAVVKAKFTGKELIFITFIQLVKNNKNQWKIISDLPIIEMTK